MCANGRDERETSALIFNDVLSKTVETLFFLKYSEPDTVIFVKFQVNFTNFKQAPARFYWLKMLLLTNCFV